MNILSVDSDYNVDIEEVETVLGNDLEMQLCKIKGDNGYKVFICYPLDKQLMVGWEVNGQDWEERRFEMNHERISAVAAFNCIEITNVPK